MSARDISDEKRRSLLDAGKLLLRQKLERQGVAGSPVAAAPPPGVGAATGYLTPQPTAASRPHHVITASGSYLPSVADPGPVQESGGAATPLGAQRPSGQQTPRDNSMANKVNELTVEKSNLMAKVFKLEKAVADLTATNGQLRQKLSSLDQVRAETGALNAGWEAEKERSARLEEEVRSLQAAVAASTEQLGDATGAEAQLRALVEQLQAEKQQLEQQLEKNTEMLQETITNRSQVETLLLQEKQKSAQLERESRERIDELEAARQQAEHSAKEREQQIKILYDEAAQKDKENQSTRSLILQKNTLMKQHAATIDQLSAENGQISQTLQERQQEVQALRQQLEAVNKALAERTSQLQAQSQAAAAAGGAGAQATQLSQANGQLQTRAEALAAENNQLRHEMASYAALLQEMQANFDTMTQLYEAKLQQAQAELASAHADAPPAAGAQAEEEDHQEQARQAQEEGAPATASGSRAGRAVGEFEKELASLQRLREKQRQHTWVVPEGGSLSVEYMQEERIHQLLDEIGQMDLLLAKAPALVEAAKQSSQGAAVAELEARLEEQERLARNAREESDLLLHAIESGDLQPYADLKVRQQEEELARQQRREQQERERQLAEAAARQEQEEARQQAAARPQAEGKKAARKGWFSWLG